MSKRNPWVWIWPLLCMGVGTLHVFGGLGAEVGSAWQLVGAYMAWTNAREDR